MKYSVGDTILLTTLYRKWGKADIIDMWTNMSGDFVYDVKEQESGECFILLEYQMDAKEVDLTELMSI